MEYISSKDVGKVAKDEEGTFWALIHIETANEYPCIWKEVEGDRFQTSYEDGTGTDYGNLEWYQEKITLYINVYDGCLVRAHPSKERAEESAERNGASRKVSAVGIPITFNK